MSELVRVPRELLERMQDHLDDPEWNELYDLLHPETPASPAPPASPGPEPLTVPASVYDALATERDSIRSALNLICWRWAKPSAADAEWLNDFLTTHGERAPRADHYRNQCAQGKEGT